MNIEFASASAEDFEDLVSLRIEAMRESLERIGRFDPVRARERFKNGFSPVETRHILFAGNRVGFLVLKSDGKEMLLDHLYVRPAFQRQGIGGSVLKRVFTEADAAGLPLRVGALRESEANAFYARNGFERIGQGEWDVYYLRRKGGAEG